MRVFHSVEESLPIERAVVTVGSYDGLHFGHRALLEQVKRRAREEGGESVVVTFWPHPRQVLPGGGDIKLLNTLPEKIYLLDEAGIDDVVVIPFTAEFAAMDSSSFVRDILVGKIGMKRFVVGYNHRFGSDGGGFDTLVRMQDELGFTAERMDRLEVHEERVSSTVVREMIASGNMKKAAEFLTRGYIVRGNVRNGTLSDSDAAKLLPPAGRYEVEINHKGNKSKGILCVSPSAEVLLEGEGAKDIDDAVITFL